MVGENVSFFETKAYVTAFASCQPGDIFNVHVQGASASYRAYFFLDNSMNIVALAGSNKEVDGDIVAPENAAFVAINNSLTGTYQMLEGFYAYKKGINSINSNIAELQSALKEKASSTSFDTTEILGCIVPLQNVSGVKTMPGNLIVIADCVNNAYIHYQNGNTVLNQPNYFATGFLPVTPGEKYKVNVGRNYAWYASDKSYISGASGIEIQSGITAPENAAFIRFSINKDRDNITTPLTLYFANINDYDTSVVIPNLYIESTHAVPVPWCYGLKINWIGDSIVDGPDFDEEVCEALGIVKDNEYGINGSTIALNGNGTDGRNALCERYVNMPDDADIIAVSCGTNDFEYAWSPIGTIESTEKTTFYGALKVLCEGLINKYPTKVIFFTTPIKRAQPFASGAGGEYTEDGVMTTPFSKNKYGKTLGDYADIIKEVCGYYSIPVLDMYRESLLNPHLASQQNLFDSALTHPNTAGRKIMARRVAGWITQLGYLIE